MTRRDERIHYQPLRRKRRKLPQRRANINFSPEEAAILDRLKKEAGCTGAALIRGALKVIEIGVKAEERGGQLALIERKTGRVVATFGFLE